uniref:Uncharacterized protein n=1 Tax=Oryza glumipatula TaxID=40148 RepID=A0A0E0BBC6_9ORYZ
MREHTLDALHCAMSSERMDLALPGRAAPAKEKSHGRSRRRTLSCQTNTASSLAGWNAVGNGMAASLRCHGLASTTSAVMFLIAGRLNSLLPQPASPSFSLRKSHVVRPAVKKWSRPPMARHSGRDVMMSTTSSAMASRVVTLNPQRWRATSRPAKNGTYTAAAREGSSVRHSYRLIRSWKMMSTVYWSELYHPVSWNTPPSPPLICGPKPPFAVNAHMSVHGNSVAQFFTMSVLNRGGSSCTYTYRPPHRSPLSPAAASARANGCAAAGSEDDDADDGLPPSSDSVPVEAGSDGCLVVVQTTVHRLDAHHAAGGGAVADHAGVVAVAHQQRHGGGEHDHEPEAGAAAAAAAAPLLSPTHRLLHLAAVAHRHRHLRRVVPLHVPPPA